MLGRQKHSARTIYIAFSLLDSIKILFIIPILRQTTRRKPWPQVSHLHLQPVFAAHLDGRSSPTVGCTVLLAGLTLFPVHSPLLCSHRSWPGPQRLPCCPLYWPPYTSVNSQHHWHKFLLLIFETHFTSRQLQFSDIHSVSSTTSRPSLRDPPLLSDHICGILELLDQVSAFSIS